MIIVINSIETAFLQLYDPLINSYLIPRKQCQPVHQSGNGMHYIQWFILFCALFSCSNHEIIEKSDPSGRFTEIFEMDKKTGKKDGFYRKYHTGQLIEECTFASDALNGSRHLFFESGNIEVEENYYRGLFHGRYKRFFEDGQLKITGEYILGEMEGIWKSFYPNGNPKETVHFTENKENGPFIEYHETGNIKAEGLYRGGDYEHGILKLYDGNGDLEKMMYCQEGFCHTIWNHHADQ